MVTQYDSVAEIEAMKWRLMRYAREERRARQTRSAASEKTTSREWEGASEAAIRAEMERRFAQRGLIGRAA